MKSQNARTFRVPHSTDRRRLPNLSAAANNGSHLVAAAPRSGTKAADQRSQQEADQARTAALLAVYATARGGLDPSDTDAMVDAGRWLQSLPASVLPLDTVADLLTSARAGVAS
jgi:hypothetical protein